jgi:acetoin utilization deacetylase AcuC-like enzyme
MTTAFVTHPDYVRHTLENHPEHAGRIEAVWRLFNESGVLKDLLAITPAPATLEQIARVHDRPYLDRLSTVAGTAGVMLDPDTYLLPESYHIALLAAGGAMAAVDAILTHRADNAMALIRPPGHHATPRRGMGFCLLNNIAIAARHAQAADSNIKKVLIVDYDVHHGNGTQDTFWTDPSVLFVSSHQYPFYPGTGALTDVGADAGEGFTINMPLRAGIGIEGFRELYLRVLWPAARRFQPDLILVSAGFDAHWADPLAMIQLDLKGYNELTRELMAMAKELCGGRIAFIMEGGYDLEVLAHGWLNIAYALLGRDTLVDPVGDLDVPQQPIGELPDHLIDLHGLG